MSTECYAQIDLLMTSCVYDDYDRLIQLCDSIAMPSGPVNIDRRMDDIKGRYGYYPEAKREMNHSLKRYFEKKMGENLYRVVSPDKALWEM